MDVVCQILQLAVLIGHDTNHANVEGVDLRQSERARKKTPRGNMTLTIPQPSPSHNPHHPATTNTHQRLLLNESLNLFRASRDQPFVSLGVQSFGATPVVKHHAERRHIDGCLLEQLAQRSKPTASRVRNEQGTTDENTVSKTNVHGVRGGHLRFLRRGRLGRGRCSSISHGEGRGK